MDDHYIRFRFVSTGNRGRDKPYEVYAHNMDEMNMFLKQHGFTDVRPESFDIRPKENFRKSDNVLHEYRFKSNHSDEVYTVMTCEFFVSKAIDDCANDLNNSLLFGEAILRDDIEIFKEILKLILYMPHAHVKDVLIADDACIEGHNIEKDLFSMRAEYLSHIEAAWVDYDAYLVNESLHEDAEYDREVCPITIEGYVSSFAILLTDTFNS